MAETNRSKVQELAQQFYDRNNPTGWFEELYSTAQGEASAIPWADLTVNPNLANWIKNNPLQGQGKKALVVGCGLGDDAEALTELGFDVVGFDISPTEIAWCQQRFPNSQVNYLVDDLLHPNIINRQQYDFILESYTLQGLPANIRQQGIESITQLLAPLGRLLIICRGRDIEQPATSLPFPLTKSELAYFEQLGLELVEFEDYLDLKPQLVRRFRIEYKNY
jgi:SAM-dependent methyltransferase